MTSWKRRWPSPRTSPRWHTFEPTRESGLRSHTRLAHNGDEGSAIAMTYELWRLVAVKDATRSTWELVGKFPKMRQATLRIHQLAGSHIVSPDEGSYWYEDADGIHTFRIEAVASPASAPQP